MDLKGFDQPGFGTLEASVDKGGTRSVKVMIMRRFRHREDHDGPLGQ